MTISRARLRFASYLAPALEPVYRFIAQHVERRLGVPTEFVEGRSFDDFGTGTVDVGFV